jgi:hypothetical protein
MNKVAIVIKVILLHSLQLILESDVIENNCIIQTGKTKLEMSELGKAKLEMSELGKTKLEMSDLGKAKLRVTKSQVGNELKMRT